MLMVTGLAMVVGILMLALWTQVIAAAPMSTTPTSPEELARIRKSLPIQLTKPIDPDIEAIDLWPDAS